MLFGCTHDIYPVKAFKYYDESAVDVEVIINNEETQHILCAFAPNTDFSKLKKVAIGSIKSEDLVQGTVYYCQIAQ
ncbi:MAG: hypothetical protein AB7V32_02940 [Candidatus Berkiella sp.]